MKKEKENCTHTLTVCHLQVVATGTQNYIHCKHLQAIFFSFRNNTMRDSLIVGLCNSLTSLYAGVVVFLILGFLADQSGGKIDEVVKGNFIRTH